MWFMQQINLKKTVLMKRILALFAASIFCTMLFSSGATADTGNEDLLKVYTGLGATADQFNTVKVQRGIFSTGITMTANICYPQSETVMADIDQGTIVFDSFEAEKGQTVKKGDLIAKVHVEQDTVALEKKKLDLQRLTERIEDSKKQWEDTKKDLQDAMKIIYNGQKEELAELQLNQKETRWENELADKIQEQTDLQEEINTLETNYGITDITAVCDGIITELTILNKGDTVADGSIIARIASPDEVLLGLNNQMGLLRYGQTYTITNSSQTESMEFEGTVVSASDMNLTGDLKSEIAYIKVDRETIAKFINNHFEVKGCTAEIKNVLFVDAKAVTMEDGVGIVKVLNDDGTITSTRFIPGGSNASYVWSVTGLVEGSNVIID